MALALEALGIALIVAALTGAIVLLAGVVWAAVALTGLVGLALFAFAQVIDRRSQPDPEHEAVE